MRVNRENLLGILDSVSPGLAARETIEQGSCFVFHKGRVWTFNDEILCSNKTPLGDIEGAVTSKSLMDLLRKLSEDEIDVTVEGAELSVKGKGRKSGIRMEEKVLLPVDTVEAPEEWKSLDKDFGEAVDVTASCVSSDEQRFLFTCVHVNPKFLEACDRLQIARYPIKMDIDKPFLVRGKSIQKVVSCGMTEISETKSWLHFRNPSGLVLSCRRFMDEYPNTGKFLVKENAGKFTFPGGLEEIVSKAEIFSGENSIGNLVKVEIRSNVISIKGEGPSGWFEERKQVEYDGDNIKFYVKPKLLISLGNKSNECFLMPGRLMVETGKFSYVTCTNDAEEKKS